jgi:hypothetical protein
MKPSRDYQDEKESRSTTFDKKDKKFGIPIRTVHGEIKISPVYEK